MIFDYARLAEYDTIIDVRSPAEYATDHVPSAVNLPVLDNDQRHEVGSLYKDDKLAARRVGMGYVAKALSDLAARELVDKPDSWSPLVYCWRGGMRSSTVVDALRKVGWKAESIQGGYRAYRAHVRSLLAELPAKFTWIVLCGPTGSGKTALLAELTRLGGSCLDLEGLANHRGSLFGDCGRQPSQKSFESSLAQRLMELDKENPKIVFSESESRRIGRVQLPDGLLACLRSGKVVNVKADLDMRARFTAKTYPAFADGDKFDLALDRMVRMVGASQVDSWRQLHQQKEYELLAHSLLEIHYDPKYERSLSRNYAGEAAIKVEVDPSSPDSLRQAAALLLEAAG